VQDALGAAAGLDDLLDVGSSEDVEHVGVHHVGGGGWVNDDDDVSARLDQGLHVLDLEVGGRLDELLDGVRLGDAP